MRPFLLATGILHMREFLTPCGTRLLEWDDVLKRAKTTRRRAWAHTHGNQAVKATEALPTKPKTWWKLFEREVLDATSGLPEDARYVKSQYQDMPMDERRSPRWMTSTSEKGELRYHFIDDSQPHTDTYTYEVPSLYSAVIIARWP
jgi:hypothetical protein